jgi:NADH dehydrogenase FAD-containing subunit
VNANHGLPGVSEHAMPFKSVDDCARIGARLARLSERCKTGQVEDVVIVGGGLEGIEALGEILRAYRRPRCFRIRVVEARERLLPEAPGALDRMIRDLCAPYDVEILTETIVQSVESEAVVTATGRRLSSAATIWTGGPAAPELLAESGLAPRASAWGPVRQTLQSVSHPDIFIAGDDAALKVPLSKQAYHALDMGRVAAGNARNLLEGRRLHDYRPSGKPTLISFGDLSCFLVSSEGCVANALGERVLAAPALSVAKEAVFELVMAQLDRRPGYRAAPAALCRLQRAAEELWRPSLASPHALARQLRFSVSSAA